VRITSALGIFFFNEIEEWTPIIFLCLLMTFIIG